MKRRIREPYVRCNGRVRKLTLPYCISYPKYSEMDFHRSHAPASTFFLFSRIRVYHACQQNSHKKLINLVSFHKNYVIILTKLFESRILGE